MNSDMVGFCAAFFSLQEQKMQKRSRAAQRDDKLLSWQQQPCKWRHELGMSPNSKPWTGRETFHGTGLMHSARVLDLLDCVAAARKAVTKQPLILDAVDGCMVDVSQSHNRRSFSHGEMARCLTTSTELYSYSRDSALTAMEYFYLQGHGDWTKDADLACRKLRSLAGEGMALPCLGQVLWSLWLTKGFPEA